MSGRRSVCVLICVFCFCCALKRKPVFSIQELTVTGKDLKDCGKNVCVISSAGCPAESDVLTATPERFVNTSCHFLSHEESITCRWIQMNDDVRTETFIFRRTDICCPSILHFYSHFNLTIKSKSIVSQKEWFSDVYPVIIKDIVQAPRPVITSVNVTDSSVNVTWNGGTITKCRIRYKRLNAESWTEIADLPASEESLFVIEGLQAFSEYLLSVSCVHDLSRWSDWSSETRVKTSESPPSAPLSLSYHVASDVNSGLRQLLLLWKALDVTDARGLIRGYEVSYMPTKQPSLKKTVHTTELKAVVLVRAEEYEVTVWAYNSAGHSPHRRLLVDASRSHDVRSVKALWVYSDGSSLRVRWDRDVTDADVSEFAIGWSAVTDPEHTHWQRVDGSTFTTRLTGLKQDEIYTISVFPVYGSVCAPQTSISADLQHGALLDVDGFRLVNVSRSALAVQWTWKQTKPRVRVLQYRLVLSGEHGAESLSVFPDQHQHSFHHLHPDSRYSVCIHGETASGNFSKASLDVSTPLRDWDEWTRFAVPAVLLLLVLGIFSVSSVTVCRKHFLPVVASPRFSLIGRWLLNPHLQGGGRMCVLKLESVFPLDQQEKSFIHVERRVSLTSEHEDTPPSKISTDAHPPSSSLDYAHPPSSLPDYAHPPSSSPDYAHPPSSSPVYAHPPSSSPDYAHHPSSSPDYAHPPSSSPDYAHPPSSSPDYAHPPSSLPDYAHPPSSSPDYAHPPSSSPDYAHPPSSSPDYAHPPSSPPDYAHPPSSPPDYAHPPSSPPDYAHPPSSPPDYAHPPSSPPDYVSLPLLADRTDYVQNGQIVFLFSEKTSD